MECLLVAFLVLNGVLGAELHTEMKSKDKSEVSSLTSSGKISNLLRDVLNQESLVRFSMTQRIQGLVMNVLDNKNNSLILNRKLNDLNTKLQSIEAENQKMKEENAQLKQDLNTVKEEIKTFIKRQIQNLKRREINVLAKKVENENSKFKQELSNLKTTSPDNKQILNNISETMRKQSDDFRLQFQTINSSLQIYGFQLLNISTQLSSERLNVVHKTCMDILQMDPYAKRSGVYSIDVGNETKKVYCDMTTDGGGWTVIQKRNDDSTDFYRNWTDYKKGFGDPSNNYWIGNDVIHHLTQQNHELRVDLLSFAGEKAYASYSKFTVGDETSKYKLTVTGFSGTAGDSLGWHNGHKFTTWDQDNDVYSGGNCAVQRHGAWWYRNCLNSNLNGQYGGPAMSGNKYPSWYHWKNKYEALKETKMMVRSKS